MEIKINGMDFEEWVAVLEQQRNHMFRVIAETLGESVEKVKNDMDNMVHIAHLYQEGKISEGEFTRLMTQEFPELMEEE